MASERQEACDYAAVEVFKGMIHAGDVESFQKYSENPASFAMEGYSPEECEVGATYALHTYDALLAALFSPIDAGVAEEEKQKIWVGRTQIMHAVVGRAMQHFKNEVRTNLRQYEAVPEQFRALVKPKEIAASWALQILGFLFEPLRVEPMEKEQEHWTVLQYAAFYNQPGMIAIFGRAHQTIKTVTDSSLLDEDAMMEAKDIASIQAPPGQKEDTEVVRALKEVTLDKAPRKVLEVEVKKVEVPDAFRLEVRLPPEGHPDRPVIEDMIRVARSSGIRAALNQLQLSPPPSPLSSRHVRRLDAALDGPASAPASPKQQANGMSPW